MSLLYLNLLAISLAPMDFAESPLSITGDFEWDVTKLLTRTIHEALGVTRVGQTKGVTELVQSNEVVRRVRETRRPRVNFSLGRKSNVYVKTVTSLLSHADAKPVLTHHLFILVHLGGKDVVLSVVESALSTRVLVLFVNDDYVVTELFSR